MKSKDFDEIEILNKRLSDIDKNPISNDELEESAKSLYKEYIFYISESPNYKDITVPAANEEKYYEAWKDTMGITELKGQLPNDKIYYMLEIKRRALKKCILKENSYKYN